VHSVEGQKGGGIKGIKVTAYAAPQLRQAKKETVEGQRLDTGSNYIFSQLRSAKTVEYRKRD
jgi:hypothetical protein